mmetsp:Transcript_60228/g.191349  ORF Transcript_60228/g.191349 Transcript_60228/m.191349 type:complete len:272 (+) Transcript_60228:148-963(+)
MALLATRGAFLPAPRWRARVEARAEPGDEDFERGVEEAEVILDEATELAEQQTRRELAESLLGASLEGEANGYDGDLAGEGGGGELGDEAREALVALWMAEGLSQVASSRLAEDLEKRGSPYRDPEAAAARLARLRRLLPGVSLGRVSAAEPGILDVNPSDVAARLMEVAGAVGGAAAGAVVEAAPSVLAREEQVDCLRRVLGKVQEWLGKTGSMEEAVKILVENPGLMARVPAYYEDKELFELPLEIQNMLGRVYGNWSPHDDTNNSPEF